MCKMFTELVQFWIQHRRWITCTIAYTTLPKAWNRNFQGNNRRTCFLLIFAACVKLCILFSICKTKQLRKHNAHTVPKLFKTFLSKEFSSISRQISAVLLFVCEFIEFERWWKLQHECWKWRKTWPSSVGITFCIL